MNWIKVTDRMPPDGEFVMVTYKLPTGERICSECKKICYVSGKWIEHAGGGRVWEIERDYPRRVTHWTHMPEPAED